MAKELNEMELNNASGGAQATNIITDPQIIEILGLKKHDEDENAKDCPSYTVSPYEDPEDVYRHKKCRNCAHAAYSPLVVEHVIFCMLGL